MLSGNTAAACLLPPPTPTRTLVQIARQNLCTIARHLLFSSHPGSFRLRSKRVREPTESHIALTPLCQGMQANWPSQVVPRLTNATRSPRAQTGALLLLPPSNCNRSLLFSSWPFDFERVNISDAECWETRWQPRTRYNTYSVVNTCSRWLMWLCTRKRA